MVQIVLTRCVDGFRETVLRAPVTALCMCKVNVAPRRRCDAIRCQCPYQEEACAQNKEGSFSSPLSPQATEGDGVACSSSAVAEKKREGRRREWGWRDCAGHTDTSRTRSNAVKVADVDDADDESEANACNTSSSSSASAAVKTIVFASEGRSIYWYVEEGGGGAHANTSPPTTANASGCVRLDIVPSPSGTKPISSTLNYNFHSHAIITSMSSFYHQQTQKEEREASLSPSVPSSLSLLFVSIGPFVVALDIYKDILHQETEGACNAFASPSLPLSSRTVSSFIDVTNALPLSPLQVPRIQRAVALPPLAEDSTHSSVVVKKKDVASQRCGESVVGDISIAVTGVCNIVVLTTCGQATVVSCAVRSHCRTHCQHQHTEEEEEEDSTAGRCSSFCSVQLSSIHLSSHSFSRNEEDLQKKQQQQGGDDDDAVVGTSLAAAACLLLDYHPREGIDAKPPLSLSGQILCFFGSYSGKVTVQSLGDNSKNGGIGVIRARRREDPFDSSSSPTLLPSLPLFHKIAHHSTIPAHAAACSILAIEVCVPSSSHSSSSSSPLLVATGADDRTASLWRLCCHHHHADAASDVANHSYQWELVWRYQPAGCVGGGGLNAQRLLPSSSSSSLLTSSASTGRVRALAFITAVSDTDTNEVNTVASYSSQQEPLRIAIGTDCGTIAVFAVRPTTTSSSPSPSATLASVFPSVFKGQGCSALLWVPPTFSDANDEDVEKCDNSTSRSGVLLGSGWGGALWRRGISMPLPEQEHSSHTNEKTTDCVVSQHRGEGEKKEDMTVPRVVSPRENSNKKKSFPQPITRCVAAISSRLLAHEEKGCSMHGNADESLQTQPLIAPFATLAIDDKFRLSLRIHGGVSVSVSGGDDGDCSVVEATPPITATAPWLKGLPSCMAGHWRRGGVGGEGELGLQSFTRCHLSIVIGTDRGEMISLDASVTMRMVKDNMTKANVAGLLSLLVSFAVNPLSICAYSATEAFGGRCLASQSHQSTPSTAIPTNTNTTAAAATATTIAARCVQLIDVTPSLLKPYQHPQEDEVGGGGGGCEEHLQQKRFFIACDGVRKIAVLLIFRYSCQENSGPFSEQLRLEESVVLPSALFPSGGQQGGGSGVRLKSNTSSSSSSSSFSFSSPSVLTACFGSSEVMMRSSSSSSSSSFYSFLIAIGTEKGEVGMMRVDVPPLLPPCPRPPPTTMVNSPGFLVAPTTTTIAVIVPLTAVPYPFLPDLKKRPAIQGVLLSSMSSAPTTTAASVSITSAKEAYSHRVRIDAFASDGYCWSLHINHCHDHDNNNENGNKMQWSAARKLPCDISKVLMVGNAVTTNFNAGIRNSIRRKNIRSNAEDRSDDEDDTPILIAVTSASSVVVMARSSSHQHTKAEEEGQWEVTQRITFQQQQHHTNGGGGGGGGAGGPRHLKCCVASCHPCLPLYMRKSVVLVYFSFVEGSGGGGGGGGGPSLFPLLLGGFCCPAYNADRILVAQCPSPPSIFSSASSGYDIGCCVAVRSGTTACGGGRGEKGKGSAAARAFFAFGGEDAGITLMPMRTPMEGEEGEGGNTDAINSAFTLSHSSSQQYFGPHRANVLGMAAITLSSSPSPSSDDLMLPQQPPLIVSVGSNASIGVWRVATSNAEGSDHPVAFLQQVWGDPQQHHSQEQKRGPAAALAVPRYLSVCASKHFCSDASGGNASLICVGTSAGEVLFWSCLSAGSRIDGYGGVEEEASLVIAAAGGHDHAIANPTVNCHASNISVTPIFGAALPFRHHDSESDTDDDDDESESDTDDSGQGEDDDDEAAAVEAHGVFDKTLPLLSHPLVYQSPIFAVDTICCTLKKAPQSHGKEGVSGVGGGGGKSPSPTRHQHQQRRDFFVAGDKVGQLRCFMVVDPSFTEGEAVANNSDTNESNMRRSTMGGADKATRLFKSVEIPIQTSRNESHAKGGGVNERSSSVVFDDSINAILLLVAPNSSGEEGKGGEKEEEQVAASFDAIVGLDGGSIVWCTIEVIFGPRGGDDDDGDAPLFFFRVIKHASMSLGFTAVRRIKRIAFDQIDRANASNAPSSSSFASSSYHFIVLQDGLVSVIRGDAVSNGIDNGNSMASGLRYQFKRVATRIPQIRLVTDCAVLNAPLSLSSPRVSSPDAASSLSSLHFDVGLCGQGYEHMRIDF